MTKLHRGEYLAVPAVIYRRDGIYLMHEGTSNLTAGRSVPYTRGSVPCGRRHVFAVWTESDIVYKAGVPAQDAVPFRQPHIPDAHSAVVRARYQAIALGRKDWRTNRVEAIGVSAKHTDQFPGPCVPKGECRIS